MTYIFSHKWKFALGPVCLLSSFFYFIFSEFNIVSEDTLMCTDGLSTRSVKSLQVFDLKRSEKWNECVGLIDLFTSGKAPVYSISNEEYINVLDEPLAQRDHVIQLDGWANVNGKMIFVFSCMELNISCMGSIGDSFEDLAFTILSYEFVNYENQSDGYSVPVVMISNNEINERIILTPASRM